MDQKSIKIDPPEPLPNLLELPEASKRAENTVNTMQNAHITKRRKRPRNAQMGYKGDSKKPPKGRLQKRKSASQPPEGLTGIAAMPKKQHEEAILHGIYNAFQQLQKKHEKVNKRQKILEKNANY